MACGGLKPVPVKPVPVCHISTLQQAPSPGLPVGVVGAERSRTGRARHGALSRPPRRDSTVLDGLLTPTAEPSNAQITQRAGFRDAMSCTDALACGVIQWPSERAALSPIVGVRLAKVRTPMATPTLDPSTILRSVATWSRDEQVRLARAILDQLASGSDVSTPTRRAPSEPASSSFDALYGIAATSGPPPSDEEIAEWLDERRMRHMDTRR